MRPVLPRARSRDTSRRRRSRSLARHTVPRHPGIPARPAPEGLTATARAPRRHRDSLRARAGRNRETPSGSRVARRQREGTTPPPSECPTTMTSSSVPASASTATDAVCVPSGPYVVTRQVDYDGSVSALFEFSRESRPAPTIVPSSVNEGKGRHWSPLDRPVSPDAPKARRRRRTTGQDAPVSWAPTVAPVMPIVA